MMGFQRAYADAGDPFRFRFKKLRLPKAVRKFKPGRIVSRLAPLAARFVPGGAIATAVLKAATRRAPRRVQQELEVARSYGIVPDEEPQEEVLPTMDDEGDLGRYFGYGDPAPRPARKRKTAGAGPRAKAARKATKRKEIHARAHAKAGGGLTASEIGGILGRNLKGAGAKTLEIFRKHGTDLGGYLSELGPVQPFPGSPRLPGMHGGSRRRINPTNVRALRHALTRVDRFSNMVHSVSKRISQLRTIGAAPGRGSSSRRRARGHRSGCGCAVCRHK